MSNGSDLKSTSKHTATPAKRPAPRSAWKPGQSGNPAGRPRKGNALTEAIRRGCDPDELMTIALKLARSSKSEMVRLHALQWLRDSGYTKPESKHELIVDTTNAMGRDLSAMPLEERRELLEKLRSLPRLTDGHATEDPSTDG